MDTETNTKYVTYPNETGVRHLASCYLNEALRAAKLENAHDIVRHRPNTLVIFDNDHAPCGVVHVRKPLETKGNPINTERFQGQMYTHLAILKSLYGVQDPIGIMTTYSDWRFCRLKPGKLTEERVFLAAKAIPFNDKNIHRYVISSLLQMATTKRALPPIVADSVFPYLSQGTFVFKILEVNEDQLDCEFPAGSRGLPRRQGHLV